MCAICDTIGSVFPTEHSCVHVRKSGTSVRKFTTKSDLQNLQYMYMYMYQCRSEQTSREEIHESEVTDFVASQILCVHAIAIEAWASGRF